MIEIKRLDFETLKSICHTQMPLDFPAAEIKPFPIIERLYKKGLYIGYGLYEGQALLGYALFCSTSDQRYILLDYLAVLQTHRCGGYGSQFLALLKQSLSSYACLLLEVEDDDYAQTKDELELRQRRIGFYIRNDIHMSAVRSFVYGCRFKIMYTPLAEPVNDDNVYDALHAVYHTLFSRKQFVQNAEISI